MARSDTDPRTLFSQLPSDRWIDLVFERLHAESPAAVREREAHSFDAVAAPFSDALLLFGAGWLGRFVLNGLRKAGVEPIAFIDNNPEIWGTTVEGLPVLSPVDALARHGATSCVVVTVYHGSTVTAQLRSAGFPRIAPVIHLFWKYATQFIPSSCTDLPHRLVEQEGAIRAGFAVLADDASRREFCEQLLWRFHPAGSILSAHQPGADTYFPDDVVVPLAEEVFVDCGAFDGDSARAFLARRDGSFGRMFLLEPDADNRAALRGWMATLPTEAAARITALPYGVSDQDATFAFRATHNAGSTLLSTDGDVSIDCRRLDTLFAQESPTFIKMDIEGAEPMAITGAAGTLRTRRPVLAICVYHRSEHLWEIPRLIHRIQPDYRLFVRRYAEDCWELVCYAVPVERLVERFASPR